MLSRRQANVRDPQDLTTFDPLFAGDLFREQLTQEVPDTESLIAQLIVVITGFHVQIPPCVRDRKSKRCTDQLDSAPGALYQA
jgi:hypothetical protein